MKVQHQLESCHLPFAHRSYLSLRARCDRRLRLDARHFRPVLAWLLHARPWRSDAHSKAVPGRPRLHDSVCRAPPFQRSPGSPAQDRACRGQRGHRHARHALTYGSEKNRQIRPKAARWMPRGLDRLTPRLQGPVPPAQQPETDRHGRHNYRRDVHSEDRAASDLQPHVSAPQRRGHRRRLRDPGLTRQTARG